MLSRTLRRRVIDKMSVIPSLICDLGGTQTRDTQNRNLMLYSTELRGHIVLTLQRYKDFRSLQKYLEHFFFQFIRSDRAHWYTICKRAMEKKGIKK